MRSALRTTANAAAFLALPVLVLVVSTIDTAAQASRQMTAIERRVQTMDQQSKQYEIENMGRDGRKPAVDAVRARQVKQEIEDDLKSLQANYNLTVTRLQDKAEITDSDFRWRRDSARERALRLQKNLAFSKPVDSDQKPRELPFIDSQRKLLRTLATLIHDLITNPVFESTDGLDVNQAGRAAAQLDDLIRFTTRGNAVHGPLKFLELFEEFSGTKGDENIDALNRKAIGILEANCNVDFIDDGMTYWALRTIGASDALILEIDKCRTAERNAVIVNRRAATPSDRIKTEEMSIMGDVIRALNRRKDLANRKRFLEVCRDFLRRWESEEEAKELTDWIKVRIPKEEQQIKTMEAAVKSSG